LKTPEIDAAYERHFEAVGLEHLSKALRREGSDVLPLVKGRVAKRAERERIVELLAIRRREEGSAAWCQEATDLPERRHELVVAQVLDGFDAAHELEEPFGERCG
jgi:hypothetical protein